MGWLVRLFGHASKEPKAGGSSGQAGAAAKAAGKPSRSATSSPALRKASAHLDPPPDEGAHFDPYNTGVFDRSAPWDRLRKRK